MARAGLTYLPTYLPTYLLYLPTLPTYFTYLLAYLLTYLLTKELVAGLISKKYAAERAQLINMSHAADFVPPGKPPSEALTY